MLSWLVVGVKSGEDCFLPRVDLCALVLVVGEVGDLVGELVEVVVVVRVERWQCLWSSCVMGPKAVISLRVVWVVALLVNCVWWWWLL